MSSVAELKKWSDRRGRNKLAADMAAYYNVLSAKEKQAALKATFVFHALITSKQTAKQAEERSRRVLASI